MNQPNPQILTRGARALVVAAAVTAVLLAASPAAATVVEDDRVAVSPDGTKIVYTLFLPDSASPANPVPAVMVGHGFGAPRNSILGAPVREHLLKHGYAIATWDARGLGESGGVVKWDNPAFEGQDARAIIDVLADDPRIAQEKPGDPRLGMTGGSYGGGIQYVTASIDDRVDAIAPEVAWHNMEQALAPEGASKTAPHVLSYLSNLPSATGLDPNHPGAHPSNPAGPVEALTGNYDPIMHRWAAESVNGDWSPPVRDFFAASGPFHLLDRVRVPVLITQGTHDLAFGPSHGAANFLGLRKAHPSLPLKMMWLCTGRHGPCKPGVSPDPEFALARIRQWMDRYVRGDDRVDTGPTFEYGTQEGRFHAARSFPPPTRPVVSERRSGATPIPGTPVLGPRGNIGRPGTVPDQANSGATPSPTAFEVPLPPVDGTLIGQPVVRMTATAPAGLGPATLYFLVVDKERNHVLGNQVSPKAIIADGKPHAYQFAIEGISFSTVGSDRLVLQVAGSAADFEPPSYSGSVRLDDVSVEVPMRIADPPRATVRPRVEVRPHRARVGRRTRFRFRATAGGKPLAGAVIRFGSRRTRTRSDGRASIVRRFNKPGRYVARLNVSGAPAAVARVRVSAR